MVLAGEDLGRRPLRLTNETAARPVLPGPPEAAGEGDPITLHAPEKVIKK